MTNTNTTTITTTAQRAVEQAWEAVQGACKPGSPSLPPDQLSLSLEDWWVVSNTFGFEQVADWAQALEVDREHKIILSGLCRLWANEANEAKS